MKSGLVFEKGYPADPTPETTLFMQKTFLSFRKVRVNSKIELQNSLNLRSKVKVDLKLWTKVYINKLHITLLYMQVKF